MKFGLERPENFYKPQNNKDKPDSGRLKSDDELERLMKEEDKKLIKRTGAVVLAGALFAGGMYGSEKIIDRVEKGAGMADGQARKVSAPSPEQNEKKNRGRELLAKHSPSVSPDMPEKEELPVFSAQVSREEKTAAAAVFGQKLDLSQILRIDKFDQIRYDSNTLTAIKNGWMEKYEKDPKLRTSLEKGIYEMGEYLPAIRQIFKNEGLPDSLMFLAIPESHWDINAQSKVKVRNKKTNKVEERVLAAGPYQFTRDSAKMFGLKVEGAVDERYDPLRSAEACARHLKDSYKKLGDWNLAIATYNGSFGWEYARQVRNNHEKPDFSGYLNYVEGKLNETKANISANPVKSLRIEKGMTIYELAKKLGVGANQLERINKLKSPNIKKGQVIKAPMTKKEQSDEFYKQVSGYRENLDYPGKFYAVQELLQKHWDRLPKKPPIKYRTIIADKRTGNLFSAARRFGVSFDRMLELNPSLRDPKARIPAGTELKI